MLNEVMPSPERDREHYAAEPARDYAPYDRPSSAAPAAGKVSIGLPPLSAPAPPPAIAPMNFALTQPPAT